MCHHGRRASPPRLPRRRGGLCHGRCARCAAASAARSGRRVSTDPQRARDATGIRRRLLRVPGAAPVHRARPAGDRSGSCSLLRAWRPGQSPVIRIGGNSTDETWWPIRGMIPPGGIYYRLTKGWLRTTQALAADLQAKLILGINLAAGRPAIAAAEGRALPGGHRQRVHRRPGDRQRARPVRRLRVVQGPPRAHLPPARGPATTSAATPGSSPSGPRRCPACRSPGRPSRGRPGCTA